MTRIYFAQLRNVTASFVLAITTFAANAEPQHAIAMYGDPALPPDFVSLPYANPDAPKGGRMIFAEPGGFDSLNPHILKGNAPYILGAQVFESLMGRSWDEPFTLYGLLAESIEVGPNRDWVEFNLNPAAKFSDGSPVTVDDVLWSYETLGTQGHPRYASAWGQVQKMEQTGERSVRFTFNAENRELALLMGLRPILKKAQWEGRDFTASGIDVVPIGSAPYVVDSFEPGRSLSLTRNPDYWGKDLPFMRGQANLDELRTDFYGDGDVVFEAFKSGNATTYREGNAAKWDQQYDFPAVKSGDVVKSIIPHKRPSGIVGYVMNTRRPVFRDWRVREAMIHAFNFEYISETLTGGDQPRISSYFSNSVLSMEPGPATGLVQQYLDPFKDDLLPGALSGYSLPAGNGSERNRANIVKALDLMAQAGWTVQDGVMRNSVGEEFSFEVVLNQGAGETIQTMDLYAAALNRMGISPRMTAVDSAQYTERTDRYDFDMAYYRRGLSLSPGTEQRLYWGAKGVVDPGSRNWMGMHSPAADAMIERLLNSRSQEEFRAAAKALDRVLTTGRYVIPIWFSENSRIAHARQLHYPANLPMYGDWIGFQPDVWWWED